jgi:hypothetical protein
MVCLVVGQVGGVVMVGQVGGVVSWLGCRSGVLPTHLGLGSFQYQTLLACS